MNRVAVRRVLFSLTLAFPLLSAACDDLLTGPKPRIQVSPGEVVFRGARPQATAYEERLTVKNIGTGDLKIDQIVLDGDQQFSLADGTPANVTLRPLASTDVYVNYEAIDVQIRRSTLTIRSNDPAAARVTVPVRNDDVAPRIVVTDCVRIAAGDGGAAGECQTPIDDLVVDFGEVRPNQCRSGEITIENTGNAELTISRPVFQAGSSPDIAFDGAAPGDLTLGPVDSQGNTQKQVIKVKYCGGTTTMANATMLLSTNDLLNQNVVVTLTGKVINNGAPVCVCNPSTLEVAPQDTINLQARCTDPDNQPLQYAWTVQRRPAGSTEQIRNPNSANASFVANTATTTNEPYVFRITATDTFGLSNSCDITVFAVPRDALHVQLVWNKDQTDVDLHFLNPVGAANPWASTGWFNSPNDCYYADRTPEWGVAGNTQDNPRLDLDDTNGFGPENINLARPQTGKFRVGVHYYCDDSVGASSATVRIFCNGQLSNEFGPMVLPRSGFFWEVADIQWPGCTITEVNQTRMVTQGCIGF